MQHIFERVDSGPELLPDNGPPGDGHFKTPAATIVFPSAPTRRVCPAHGHRGNGQRIHRPGSVYRPTTPDDKHVPTGALARFGQPRVSLQRRRGAAEIRAAL